MTRQELKEWMTKRGLTKSDLSRVTLISLSTISRFLSGKTTPHPLVLAEIQRIVNLNPVEIRTQPAPMSPSRWEGRTTLARAKAVAAQRKKPKGIA